MPCCAFAACIVGQILLAFGFVRRALFGDPGVERNAAVEWHPGDAPPAAVAPRFGLSARGLAFALAVEIVIVVAGIWAFAEHASHDRGHAHAHYSGH